MAGTTTREFEEFIKRQESAAVAGPPVDWDKEREEWVAHLGSLYEQIEAFLKKYTGHKGSPVRIEYNNIELNEEYIGRYVVRQMALHIGRQEITFTPIGRLLIGVGGRVDVAGSAGKAWLARVDKDAVDAGSMIRVKVTMGRGEARQRGEEIKKSVEWAWKIATPPPLIKFIDLNAESFYQMLMEISNA
jgi:hypothetical protein